MKSLRTLLIFCLLIAVPAGVAAWSLWGRFELHAIYELPAEPLDLVLADINLDESLDVLVASRSGRAISVLIGLGNGNFDQLEPILLPGGATSLAIADMNSDGAPDIITTICNKHCTDNSIGILLGDGRGQFNFTEQQHVAGVPYNILAGEFNGNSDIDIAASDYPSGSLILMQDVYGEKLIETKQYSGEKTIALIAGDLNQDGKEDLLLANQGSASITVFMMENNRLSDKPIITSVQPLPYAIAVGRLDDDSYLDLLVAHSSSPGIISTWKGLGDGNFELIGEVLIADRLIFIAADDVNTDGFDDAIITYHEAKAATVYLNTGNGILDTTSPVGLESENKIYSAVVGDINHDDLPDLLTADFKANTLSVALGGSIETADK